MPTTRTAALRTPRDLRPDAPHLTLVRADARADAPAPRDATAPSRRDDADVLTRIVDTYGWAL